MIVIALFLNNPFVANIEILVIINAPFVIYVTFRYWIDKRLKWLKMTLSVEELVSRLRCSTFFQFLIIDTLYSGASIDADLSSMFRKKL